MIRKAFVMKVYPDKIEEYTRRHNPVWTDLEALLKAHGVADYSIYWQPTSCTLFATARVASEEQWAAIARTPICRRWWAYMQDIMETNPDDSPVTTELREVFHLP
ncbi:L-rhamnose mutarotase [Lewinella sp. JB7]|uniref:L-rhamnose mutarotase n=1 Tax=Lewinella sp. JB7 TaxID=2962887 RepID=UPI0020C963E2|nr:L-rhamnose mutarotase [Lewinella sp. JB7]MCP9236020.1 L-rhamnose mutarotase [Lewinella sp. JB7]